MYTVSFHVYCDEMAVMPPTLYMTPLPLQQSRLFIGLGFPYEGPAPLEAIAQGCVFLNPRVNPPIDRTNSKFFAKKPTNRQVPGIYMYVCIYASLTFTAVFNDVTKAYINMQVDWYVEHVHGGKARCSLLA